VRTHDGGVVTDANVLIDLIHVGRLRFCRDFVCYDFVVPDNVREEIIREQQRAALDEALADGTFRIASGSSQYRLTDCSHQATFGR